MYNTVLVHVVLVIKFYLFWGNHYVDHQWLRTRVALNLLFSTDYERFSPQIQDRVVILTVYFR